ncbi:MULTISPECIES: HIT family protein [Clavibacter]|nr:HIT family protein [Clavibacter michiganensis]
MPSPFTAMSAHEHVAANELAFAVRDANPVTPGHSLVIPRREVATWFEATPEEQVAIMALVTEVKDGLEAELHPDGWNVGINVGAAGGQTVFHLHVHLIPRFHGDSAQPGGDLRGPIPGRGHHPPAG